MHTNLWWECVQDDWGLIGQLGGVLSFLFSDVCAHTHTHTYSHTCTHICTHRRTIMVSCSFILSFSYIFTQSSLQSQTKSEFPKLLQVKSYMFIYVRTDVCVSVYFIVPLFDISPLQWWSFPCLGLNILLFYASDIFFVRERYFPLLYSQPLL